MQGGAYTVDGGWTAQWYICICKGYFLSVKKIRISSR